MKINRIGIVLLGFCIFLSTCDRSKVNSVEIPTPQKVSYGPSTLNLEEQVYYDKVLGALVASAIGDAMGASTEMWNRTDIQKKYGYINGLTPAIREKSPEGTWDHNMLAGSTTDDTRWKALMTDYFSKNKEQLGAKRFATFISNYYQSLVEDLSQESTQSTDALDRRMEQVNWIKEWARVSMAFQESPQAYQKAQHRFYGGEMSCAGMLYSPMLGLISQNAEEAYQNAYEHALFDLGYAKDITSLVAAMTQVAIQSSDLDSILNVVLFVDPLEYKNSRLIGRLTYAIADDSEKLIELAKENVAKDTSEIEIPENYPGTELSWRLEKLIYAELEDRQKAIAFHAGEIWQILYTGLVYGEGDFEKTMTFIVNYGRDNDTVAAIAGMILGANLGFEQLPNEWKNEVLAVNKNTLGIDLEQLAQQIVNDHKALLK